MPHRPIANERLHRPPPIPSPPPGPVNRHRIRRRPLRKRPHPPGVPIRPHPLLPPLLIRRSPLFLFFCSCRSFLSVTFHTLQNGDSSQFRRPCETWGLSYFCPTL